MRRTVVGCAGTWFAAWLFCLECASCSKSTPASVSTGSGSSRARSDTASGSADNSSGAGRDAAILRVTTPSAIVDDDGGAACDFGTTRNNATADNLDLFGTVTYFGNGNALPPGRYRLQYVDGCMKYGAGQDWTVHAYADGRDAFWLVGESKADKIGMPPGTTGYNVDNGAFAQFDDCVRANAMLPPLALDFEGGKLGVWLQDTPYTDNRAGNDGRNPEWSLTLLGACPKTQ